MTDQDVLDTIHDLMATEHELATANVGGGGSPEIAEQLTAIEVEIDRHWDLLRQRRAHRRAGQDPDLASLRPASEVEGYQQ
jgi:hypothetical protein